MILLKYHSTMQVAWLGHMENFSLYRRLKGSIRLCVGNEYSSQVLYLVETTYPIKLSFWL